MRNRKITFILILLAILTAPYLVVFFSTGSEAVFGGFLINPLDGNSYLAKMQIGLQGGWRFRLPYTAEPGEGAYLFLFYIFLGHLSRWSGIAPILVFHVARILSAAGLFFILDRFFRVVFADEQPEVAQKAFYLAACGSGLGWLASFAGLLTPDLWVPEAFPFFSAYTTPHFSMGMALLLGIFTLFLRCESGFRLPGMAMAGALLAIIMPFGIVTALLVVGVHWLWKSIVQREFSLPSELLSLAPGGALLVYQYWAAVRDPVLIGWNAQNLTPAPTVGEFILGFSPALLPALWAVYRLRKAQTRERTTLLVFWLVSGAALTYFPFPLQRRFMFALFVPIAGLAAQAMGSFPISQGKANRIWAILLILSAITNVFVLLAGLFGLKTQDDKIFLSQDEKMTLEWVKANTRNDALILASPETGLFIPAHTGRRVLYGHPFETVNGEGERENVEAFFSGDLDSAQENRILMGRGVDYIWVGPRELNLGRDEFCGDLAPVFRQGAVALYAVGQR